MVLLAGIAGNSVTRASRCWGMYRKLYVSCMSFWGGWDGQRSKNSLCLLCHRCRCADMSRSTHDRDRNRLESDGVGSGHVVDRRVDRRMCSLSFGDTGTESDCPFRAGGIGDFLPLWGGSHTKNMVGV